MTNSNIGKVMENNEFVKKVLESKTSEEVKQLFSEQNIQIDEKELQELSELIHKVSEIPSEVSDKELEVISGGIDAGGVATGIMIGGALASGVAVVGMYKAFKAGIDYSDSWWKKCLKHSNKYSKDPKDLKDSKDKTNSKKNVNRLIK